MGHPERQNGPFRRACMCEGSGWTEPKTAAARGTARRRRALTTVGVSDRVAKLDHPVLAREDAREPQRAPRQPTVEERFARPDRDRRDRDVHLVEEAFVRELRRDVAAADDPEDVLAGGR